MQAHWVRRVLMTAGVGAALAVGVGISVVADSTPPPPPSSPPPPKVLVPDYDPSSGLPVPTLSPWDVCIEGPDGGVPEGVLYCQDGRGPLHPYDPSREEPPPPVPPQDTP